MRRTTVLLAMVLLAAACGTGSADAPRELVCEVELGEIAGAIRSGLPDYDYDPSADAAALIANTDRVISGALVSLQRVHDGVEQQLTIFTTADGAIFNTGSWWASRDEADPLEGSVTLHDVVFVAFLHEWPAGSGAFTLDVQGGGFGCAGSTDAAKPFIEPLPSDLRGQSVDMIIDAFLS